MLFGNLDFFLYLQDFYYSNKNRHNNVFMKTYNLINIKRLWFPGCHCLYYKCKPTCFLGFFFSSLHFLVTENFQLDIYFIGLSTKTKLHFVNKIDIKYRSTLALYLYLISKTFLKIIWKFSQTNFIKTYSRVLSISTKNNWSQFW